MSDKFAKIRKMRILESEYIESHDLIKWKVKFHDDNAEQTYIWPSADLLAALCIRGSVDKKLLHKFCADVLNKDVNLAVESLEQKPQSKLTEQQYTYLDKKMEEEFINFKNKMRGDSNG